MAARVAAPFARITKVEELENFARVIAGAFSNDALNRFIFLGRESRPDHPKLDDSEGRVQYWLPIVKSRFETGAILIQSSDWAAVALWLPPGIEKPKPAANAPEGSVEYRKKVDELRKKHLGDKPHWNLNLIGRAPDRLDRGAVRGLIEPYLQKAREDNLPAWLEATNSHARDVYTHFGFKVVDDFRIGKGIVNGQGWIEHNGEGVLIYAMIAGL
ncbi:hypothetical protein LTR10_016920 [Elasticomyces elasticus]|uniref:N-acetyltransferase domain-containing protein n=1 Tax=Exophiala sideris TaxID=1016849 RepID=A0ABR0JEX4_9EURO|nr:hypothetical protein LTR10_016920 [Elasticomyces elasticus]KAK5025174.1 hypothetical protein LTS07_008025 [Exophiala sideris]KAK5029279.1 hypothetical protein LTR13_008816 [Exophiala sideris]KAK5063233.1 hypothetical protein LTR69_003939 [Exophiala sideris]KAK5178949.1 hypothetical protein LTR44_008438 [Eurotiomycetes sp. CCFEE 6388]